MSKYIVTHRTADLSGNTAQPGDELELNESQAKSRVGQVELVKEKKVEAPKAAPKAKAKAKPKSKSED